MKRVEAGLDLSRKKFQKREREKVMLQRKMFLCPNANAK